MKFQNLSAGITLLEIGLVVSWSSGFIGGVLASQTSSIYLVLFWRFMMCAVLLVALSFRYLKSMSKQEIVHHSLVGAFAMFGYLATMIAAINLGVPAGTAALIAALQPIVTAALAGAVLKEKVAAKQWVGLSLGFSGVALSVLGGLDEAPLFGYFLAFLSMVFIVVATVLTKRKSTSTPLLPTLAIQSTISAMLFCPLAVIDHGLVPEFTTDFVISVLWFVVFSTLLAYGFYWANLARSSATRVASLIYLTPPVTALWAYMMFGEAITLPIVVGFVLSLLGIFIAQRRTNTTDQVVSHSCK